MDYHLFVLTITLVVYFIMKRYYSKKELSSNKKSGRLIYLLSVPFVMYLYKYFYSLILYIILWTRNQF